MALILRRTFRTLVCFAFMVKVGSSILPLTIYSDTQYLPGPYLVIIDVGDDMSGDIQKLPLEQDPRPAGDKGTRRFHKGGLNVICEGNRRLVGLRKQTMLVRLLTCHMQGGKCCLFSHYALVCFARTCYGKFCSFWDSQSSSTASGIIVRLPSFTKKKSALVLSLAVGL